MEVINLWFDYERAEIVFPAILEAFQNKSGIFGHKNVFLPQKKYIPDWIESGSLEHAQYLFTVAPFVIANNKSSQIMECLFRLFNNWQELLSGLYMRKYWLRESCKPASIATSLEKLGMQYYVARGQHEAMFWNAAWLTVGLGGNPLNLYQGIDSIEDLEKRLNRSKVDIFRANNGGNTVFTRKIRCWGIGPKVARLLDHWFWEVDWDPNVGKCPELIGMPADIWMRRFLLRTEMMIPEQGDKVHHHNAEIMVRNFYEKSCHNYGFPPAILSAAIWLLGSFLCRKYSPNVKNPSAHCERYCPIQDFCHFHIPVGSEYENGLICLDFVPRKRQLALFKFIV